MEVRLSKLNRVRPEMTVLPSSSDVKDVETAKLSKDIISATAHRLELNRLITEATNWSEVCGTCFYKVVWKNNYGRLLGENDNKQQICEGDLDVIICPPYDIYPYDNSLSKLSDNPSIIHAKAYPLSEIKSTWGVEVEAENTEIFSINSMSNGKGSLFSIGSVTKNDHAIVIEKYELPTENYPNGKLVIVAGMHLLYQGDLPYLNIEGDKRGYPFIKQTVNEVPGCFWGISIIERCIPLQRAYNAVKNRKYEYMNRLSMGVLIVEDGSVDTDLLEEDGLEPGKLLIYRQGSNPPQYMSNTNIPADFTYEEERLLNEFMVISGVSDLMRNSQSSVSNMSGTALSLLVEQDDNRLSVTSDNIRNAVREIARHILRLYKQFAVLPHCSKKIGEKGNVEQFYFSSSDISSDDIVFETENELSQTIAQKRSMVFELLNAGLLYDEDGKLSNTMRVKALELLGFGVWDNTQDLKSLHLNKAKRENIKFSKGESISVSEIDNHKLHIDEHTAFMLSNEGSDLCEDKTRQEKMLEHIRKHKQFSSLTKQTEE